MHIDHNIISINLYNKFGNSSSIKFGSYDLSAISPVFKNSEGNRDLFMMDTIN